jgi:lipopolysaccharide/colanic/teichoic acid biosynthesis glycosyltransferase
LDIQNSRRVDGIVHKRSAAQRPKRIVDLLIACTLLAITLPLLLIVALAIKVDSPGPVLEKQTCIGLGGRRFRMLQFRTGAWEPRYFVPPWAREPTGMAQFLRGTRIEGLPRLINVLRGEMGIIDREAGSPSFLD